MPPKSMKRKASTVEDLDAETPRKLKVSKSDLNESTLASPPQPTNTKMPESITFPPRHSGSIRISSWNVCGLAASMKKGFNAYLEAEDPDILILTETKMNNPPVNPALTARFPFSSWSFADKKSYSGTAVLSKIEPISVSKTLPGHPDSSIFNGRIITLEFTNTYLIATYVPNAGQDLKTLNVKNEWNVHFTKYIRDLNEIKPVIWAGDLNVAPTALDLKNAKKCWNKTAGYTEAETTAYANILSPPEASGSKSKFVDVWRMLHPQLQHYTYFSYRFNCRANGTGWRLDMFVLNDGIVDRVKMCEIRDDIYGASDHCPIVIEVTEL